MATLAASALCQGFEQEIAAYRALIEVLYAEQEALRAADPSAVASLSGAKVRHVEALRAQGLKRMQSFTAAGAEMTREGIALLLSRDPDPATARGLWAALVRLVDEANRLNRINGRLIAMQQQHFERALNALWQAAGGMLVYGSDGRPRRGSASRTLAAI